MHPYRHVFLHRSSSRLLWFLIGAGVATCWHHSGVMRDRRAQHYPCVMQRRPVQDPPSDTPPQDAAPGKSTWGTDRTATAWNPQRDWEQDRERLRHLQKRAGETVADLSESTLDSIVTAAESLKVKLAELRLERERLEAEKKASSPAA